MKRFSLELGSEASKLGSEASKLGSEASKLGSEASKLGSEASKLGSEASKLGSEASKLGSEASKLGSFKRLVCACPTIGRTNMRRRNAGIRYRHIGIGVPNIPLRSQSPAIGIIGL
jgi:hypothetical protein